MQDPDSPKMYKVELLVESYGPPDLVRTDIVNALAPKGFYPKVRSIEKI